MLDLIGSIGGMLAVAINLVAFMLFLPGPLSRRLSLAAIAGAWVGLATGLGGAGRLAFSPEHPVPLIGVLFAAPLLTVGAFALLSSRVRSALTGIPMQVLIGLNAMRTLGVLFLFLYTAGRLGGPFPFSAGIGDIITGVFAIPLALSVAQSQKLPVRTIRRWNAFGALDLIAAIGLGLTSAAGSPLHLIHAGAGSQAMQYLPYCLIPTVLVPFYLVTHAIVAAQLRARAQGSEAVGSALPTLRGSAMSA